MNDKLPIKDLIFDFGLYTNIGNLNSESLRAWLTRNLSLQELPADEIAKISNSTASALEPLYFKQEYKYLIERPKEDIAADKTGRCTARDNWVAYLALLGNASYNEEVGGNVPNNEAFHYCDHLFDPSHGVVGSSVPYDVFCAMVFKDNPEIAKMFAARTRATFPELSFDIDAWKASLAYSASLIEALPSPSPQDFCQTAANKYSELTNSNCDAEIAKTESAITTQFRAADGDPEKLKTIAKAVAKDGALLLATYDPNKDSRILSDLVVDYQYAERPHDTVEFHPEAETVDPADAYIKEFGDLDAKAVEDLSDDERNRLQAIMGRLTDAASNEAKQDPAVVSLMTTVAYNAAKNPFTKIDKLLESVVINGQLDVDALTECAKAKQRKAFAEQVTAERGMFY